MIIPLLFGGISELIDSELKLTDSTVDYGNSALINVTYSGATGIDDVKVLDEDEIEVAVNITVGDGIITKLDIFKKEFLNSSLFLFFY
ncbi:MAG: hypothetical protein IJP12_01215 [Methanobrevibacter sp.]|nr:hypothetical protein [Methanobrevibacter sp.]